MEHRHNIDDATAILVLHHWLEDVKQQIASRGQDRGDGEQTDADRQLEVTKASIISRLGFHADRATAATVGDEGDDEGDDDMDYDDDHEKEQAPDESHDGRVPQLGGATDEPHHPAAAAAAAADATTSALLQCDSCGQDFAADDMTTPLPCGHQNCKGCLRRRLERSLEGDAA